jgi:methionyl-tRNA formyltransferase
LKENLKVALVVSQPDKEVGRKRLLEETPIKIFARENNLKILQPTKLKDNFEFFDELKALNLDFIVVVAYGKIIPKEVLEIPKFGCINVHGSILPAYRGASPVQEALKN